MSDESLPVESTEPAAPPPPADDDSLSLADHEARYSGQQPQEARAESTEPPAEAPAPEAEAEAAPTELERDEKGRYLPKKRHRAASQEASPEDKPRIRELTARLRAAEAERDALKARTSSGQTPASSHQPSLPPSPPPPSPKPTPDQFQDYGEYVEALTDWKTDQKLVAAEQQRQQREQQRAAEVERERLTKSWTERVKAAKQKYPDFEDVALQTDTRIPQGSLIDGWILEHKAGADVLYHLQSHPDELDDLMALPLFEQAETLALLSQRFNGSSTGRVAAGSTGAVPASASPPSPKPPNPVRTGPVRAGDEPPDPEVSSLADHEKYWKPRKQRGG